MRTLSVAQSDALAAKDRTTFSKIKVEDPDGTMVDVSTLGPIGESLDFLDGVEMDTNTDQPIGALTVTLRREIAGYSISPLVEGSLLNRNAAGSYAALLNPNRAITWEVAALSSASPGPASGDWVKIFDGYIDVVDWGGRESRVVLRCRDGMARLNDKFIETTSSYGDDAGTEDIEDVMQEILTAEISSPSVTLAFTATSFAVLEYELGNVTVLEALHALRDLIGWNLTWRWNTAAADFRLTLWEPNRSNTTADYTFDTDDYYLIPEVGLDLAGIRNKGEVVYISTSGTVATATETRTISTTLYSTRFIRVDARGTSVVTATQAATLLDNILDDLEEPSVQQQIETAFFWPVELGDLYAFSANQHYDTEQKWGVFGFRHIVAGRRARTILTVSGKPSGGYARWHAVEGESADTVADPFTKPGTILHVSASQRSHTGDTSLTTLQTVSIPPLYDSGVRNAVRVRGMFTATGAGGTKAVALVYAGGPSHEITLPSGDQKVLLEATFTATGSSTIRVTFDMPEVVWPAVLLSSPVDVDIEQDITFTVDLANAGDSAALQMSEVVWLGVAS